MKILRDLLNFIKSIVRSKDFLVISLIVSIYLLLLLFFSRFVFHYQEDEFLTAYISANLPSLSNLSWFSLYPLDNSWVTQFPILFFAFQKPFFNFLGVTIDAIRISVWPYHIASVILLWLIAKEFFTKRLFQILTILIFVFLAPNIYLSSLGLHFISSTVFFLGSFYAFLILLKKPNYIAALLCGIFMGFSYLTYASSYITLPSLLLFLILFLLFNRRYRVLIFFLISFLVFLAIVSPYLGHTAGDSNFLFKRVNQVSIANSDNSYNINRSFYDKLVYNFESLYTNDRGGVNEYYFGRQALYNSITFILLLVGLITFSYYTLRKDIIYSFPPIVIVVVFILGMVLTVPPGAFHRTYISFPFIALIITGGLEFLASRLKKKNLKLILLPSIILIFILTNLLHAYSMVEADKKISILTDSYYIEHFIKKTLNGDNRILISAYPAYHLGKELFFRTNNAYSIKTDYFPHQAQAFRKGDLLILHYPEDEQIKTLRTMYPNGKVIESLGKYNLKYHKLFTF